MTATARSSPGHGPRNGGIDALRAAMTALVVFHHTAITYGGEGGWYYREIPGGGPSSLLLTLFCTINQAYFMGLFFLIAGYFTPGAVDGRGGVRGFVTARLIRLGVPLLIYGFLIGPATIALARTARGDSFVAVFLNLLSQGRFNPGPLWFAEALLIFAAGFLLYRLIDPTGARAVRAVPGDRALLLAALGTGLIAFLVRLGWPVGREIFGLQLGYFPGYVMLFAAGCLGAGGRWLERVPEGRALRWWRIGWLVLPILPLAAIAGPRLGLSGSPLGGVNLPAAVYAFWEPFIAWGAILFLLVWFQRRFARLGPFGQAMADRAYTVYIIHPPILVGVALLWAKVPAPALLKFLVTGSLAWGACFVLAGLILRLPGARRVL